MRSSKWLAFLLAVISVSAAYAVQLGAIGPTYPIGEENALDRVLNKLRSQQRSGAYQRMQDAAVRRALNSLQSAKPVQGLVTVTQRAQRLIDPTVTTTQAVTTEDGRLVIPVGTKINPLDILPLSKRLVFFDGRDAAQCEAVRALIARSHTRIKPILVAGSWLALTKAWKTQVYVDQQGVLSRRFGIRAVPSIIRQRKNTLLLEEIPAQELK
jgi:conjugal transfer pilus assembly protein TraW